MIGNQAPKHIVQILNFVLCLIFAGTILFISPPVAALEGATREPLVIITSSGEHNFDVEIAATRATQSRGLMFRRSLAPENGMLFVYPEAQYVSMWMRNTYISLDMVFILPNGRVHRIEKMTEPHSERIIESGARIGAVLEILAGTAERINLKPGDRVRNSHFKPAM